MIVGCHSGNNNYTLQTFIDLKVQRPTRNINDIRPFLDTDDSDKIDTSDALPFPQLLPSLIPTLAASRLQLANRADVEDRSARRKRTRRQHVVQSQEFRKTLNANRLWLEQPPIRCFFWPLAIRSLFILQVAYTQHSLPSSLNDQPATGPYLSLVSLTGAFARWEGDRPDQTACIPVKTGSTYTRCTHV
jgi:hypothetical protein